MIVFPRPIFSVMLCRLSGVGVGVGVRYVPPHRVGFLRRFCLKTGIGIHFGHFGLESGIVFEGTTGVYEHIY